MKEKFCSLPPRELLLQAFQRIKDVKEIAQIPIYNIKFTESHTLLP